MCSIQNVTRKQGTCYFGRLIRLGPDKPFRLRFSLKTSSRKRAALLAPAMTLICERLAMNMTVKIATDRLTAPQRAEMFALHQWGVGFRHIRAGKISPGPSVWRPTGIGHLRRHPFACAIPIPACVMQHTQWKCLGEVVRKKPPFRNPPTTGQSRADARS